MLAVIIPTIDGRDEHLSRCLAAYRDTLQGVHHLVHVERNHATCGAAWNKGVATCEWLAAEMGEVLDFIHLTADDLEPLPGWWPAALATLEAGACPVPYVWNAHTGAPESGGAWHQHLPAGTLAPMSVVPCLRVEWWYDIPPIHYYSDNAVSSYQLAAGRQQVVTPGYAFRHWWADAGRLGLFDQRGQAEGAVWAALHAELGLA